MWSSEGSRFSLSNGGVWWADLGMDRWPPPASAHRSWIMERWQTPYGDRRQEIVLIGQDLPRARLVAQLDDCLLTDSELSLQGGVYANAVDLALH